MQLVGIKPQRQALAGPLAKLLHQSAAVCSQACGAGMGGDERALAMPHLQQPVADQAFVHPQNRVLIDG